MLQLSNLEVDDDFGVVGDNRGSESSSDHAYSGILYRIR